MFHHPCHRHPDRDCGVVTVAITERRVEANGVGLVLLEAKDPHFTGGLTKHVLEGTGHFMDLEASEAVNSLVAVYLTRG